MTIILVAVGVVAGVIALMFLVLMAVDIWRVLHGDRDLTPVPGHRLGLAQYVPAARSNFQGMKFLYMARCECGEYAEGLTWQAMWERQAEHLGAVRRKAKR